MKNKILVLLLILVFTLTACGDKDKVYKLGYIGTLSGEYAEVGLASMYGAQLAIDEINETGGIDGYQIELIVRDDEADPSVAVEMQNELSDLGVDIVIGHSLSIVAVDAVNNANDIGMLLLSASIGTDELSDKDDSFIRIVATVANESFFITNKLIDSGSENVLMLYNTENLVLTKYHRDTFVTTMTEEGYTTENYLTYPFSSGNQTDLNQIESYLSSGEFDTLFIASSNLDAAGIVNYVSVNDIDIDIHLTSWASTGLLDNIDLTKTDHIYGYINFDNFNSSAEYVSFTEEYERLYDREVNMLSVNGYDIVYMFKEAVEKTGSFDNDDIKDTIIEIGEFTGVNSTFEINQYGDCLREHVQLTIIDGAFQKKE